MPKTYVIALGNFDGVHLGHQVLIHQAVRIAHELGVKSKVVTFDPHPLAVINPPHTRIMSLKQQSRKFHELGCEEVQYLKFDEALRNTRAEDFLTQSLSQAGLIKGLVVGFNFRFGKGREGDANTLLAWGARQGVKVEVVEPITLEGQVISSSQVRKFLKEGAMERVTQMLGAPLELNGRVIRGDQRGRKLGFPTLNLSQIVTELPASGVYVAKAQLKEKPFWGVVHIGELPTFGIFQPRVELHLLDFDQDLSDLDISFQVLSRIREVMKFESQEELVNQIQADIKVCRDWISRQ